MKKDKSFEDSGNTSEESAEAVETVCKEQIPSRECRIGTLIGAGFLIGAALIYSQGQKTGYDAGKNDRRLPSQVSADETRRVYVPDTKYSESLRSYIVRQGDSFYTIAQKYSGVSYRDIERANRNLNPKKIKPGQKIIIPSGKEQRR